jgi:hypothetical protein
MAAAILAVRRYEWHEDRKGILRSHNGTEATEVGPAVDGLVDSHSIGAGRRSP